MLGFVRALPSLIGLDIHYAKRQDDIYRIKIKMNVIVYKLKKYEMAK